MNSLLKEKRTKLLGTRGGTAIITSPCAPDTPGVVTHWTEQLKTTAKAAGADLVGVADFGPFHEGGSTRRSHGLHRFTRAVSVAVALDSLIVDGIHGAPTPDYVRHYHAVNSKLDIITAELAKWIASQGFFACPIPASHIVDENNLLGSISHKAVARMAGIGWQGKSLLIVNPRYGPRIRLSTLLTDMPLACDEPLKNRCGTCQQCAKACPASAIKNVPTESHYQSREEALDLQRCLAQTLRFKSRPGIGTRICGVCVKVCPFGLRRACQAQEAV